MGNIPFGRFSVTKPQTPNPVILHQFVAAWPCYFWRKIQTFFPNPNFARVRYVRTHATEISQLKLMGNLVFVCISKNKPVNPYPVILYKIVGSPPPHLCQKIRVRRCGRIGRQWHQVTIHASGNPQLKSMGNIPFGRFSVTKPQTPNPVILHQFVAAWPYYFWRKIQTFFPNPNFARVEGWHLGVNPNHSRTPRTLFSFQFARGLLVTHDYFWLATNWSSRFL